jgi:integrase/recombinase XerD
VRVERAIDAFLDWRRLERDATPRSVDSYWRILVKLSEDFPEVEIAELTTGDLRQFLNRWRDKSAATRSNVISVVHSFFGWAEAEDLIESDPSRKIRRPPKRRPDIYRPSVEELTRLRAAASVHELPAILLMEGAGLRRAEVLACSWEDVDLERERVRVQRKGRHWYWLPLDPDVARSLAHCRDVLQPEPDDYVFAVQVEVWASATERVRHWKDKKRPASEQALWRMVQRVSQRAGIRGLSPHQLRHGFANRFLRESGRDFIALQKLMGHARPDTTQLYTDEIEMDGLRDALERAAAYRRAQASSELATLEEELARELESPLWRRRESNPRPQPHRLSVYKRRLPFRFARRPGCSRPTGALADPFVSRFGRSALPPRRARSLAPPPSHGQSRGGVAG